VIETGTLRCSKCGEEKDVDQFASNNAYRRGRQYYCRSCWSDYVNARRQTAAGRAERAWGSINMRAGNRDGYHPSYVGVEVRMTREQFVAWAVPEFAVWMSANPGKRPSVDRIRSDGHYELGNIRVMELGENSARHGRNKGIHAPPGQAWCCGCQSYHPVVEFGFSKYARNGLHHYCKAYRRKQREARTEKQCSASQ
jgi:hypothetical protein